MELERLQVRQGVSQSAEWGDVLGAFGEPTGSKPGITRDQILLNRVTWQPGVTYKELMVTTV